MRSISCRPVLFALGLLAVSDVVRIASTEGERERPERSVDVVVVTDSGNFEGSGAETSTITVSLE